MSVAIKKILYAADAKESALSEAQDYLSQFMPPAEAEAEAEAEDEAWVFWLPKEVCPQNVRLHLIMRC